MTHIIGHGRYARETYPTPKPVTGAAVIQGRFVQPIAPGQDQDFTTALATNLLDGAGSPLQTVLPNNVRSNSVFRLSFGIDDILPTVLGPGNVGELVFRGVLFNADDPNFPAGLNPFGVDLGHIAGSVTFVKTSFSWEALVTQAMIAAVKIDNQPTFGHLGFRLQAALQDGAGADTIRIQLFPNTIPRTWLGIEEIAGGTLIVQ